MVNYIPASTTEIQSFITQKWIEAFVSTFASKTPLGGGYRGEALATGESEPVSGFEQALSTSTQSVIRVAASETVLGEIARILEPDAEQPEATSSETALTFLRETLVELSKTVGETYRLDPWNEPVLGQFEAPESVGLLPVRLISEDAREFIIFVGVSPSLPDFLAERAKELVEEQRRSFDLMLNLKLPVSVSFGKTRLPLKDVLKLGEGSLVKLDRGAEDWVEVIVNDSVIAWGDVVSVEGKYGICIRKVAAAPPKSITNGHVPGKELQLGNLPL